LPIVIDRLSSAAWGGPRRFKMSSAKTRASGAARARRGGQVSRVDRGQSVAPGGL
jgi:hypothetical protein